ncbi:hypothetical protein JDV02_008883 [Purpureocillium takamizusanense]|uniref:non-specific serine/threonine protein kinase n=1 Tax=Purpureocillium takamizusanense TaxID=2060973 RepID=A0A9Q8QNU2_9HYPO|nr:uncharacterized protein JDV02_008883 [Purpureocillium takamizusanense]UNI23040.1 hypothetical protein JDV02_008883 [Purpureocillium takamizusanense]
MGESGLPLRPPSLALFSLVSKTEAAKEVVAHPGNRHLVWKRDKGDLALAIGHVRSTVNSDTLASIGRNADVLIHSGTISQVQCAFEFEAKTGHIVLYDRSRLQTTQVFGKRCAPFTRESRSMVIAGGDDIQLGFGGVDSSVYLFELLWHATQADITARVANPVRLRDNPRLALTADEIDLGPTRLETPRHGMQTRIHVPVTRRPNYQTVALIGEGAFGRVHQAMDKDQGVMIAFKVLRAPAKDTSAYEEWWFNLKREVETLHRVHHKNVISIIGTENLTTNSPRLFMPLMDGNLEQLAKECAGQESDLCGAMTHEMLQALDYLHVNSVIHRDIKPANILYKREKDKRFRFVLGDFGLCNNANMAETCGRGTPLYMAPEVLGVTQFEQSSRSDIWSLLVTIIWTLDQDGFRKASHALPGPWNAPSGMEQCWKLVQATSHGLPKWNAMCNIDPSQRPSAAELLCSNYNGQGLVTPRRRIPWVKVTPPEPAATPKPPAQAAAPKGSPQAAVPKGSPQAATPKPSQQAANPKPSPQAANPKPSPQAANPKPSPQAATPRPSPQAAAPKPSPQAATPRPSPQAAAPKPSPQAVTPRPSPQAAAPKPSPQAKPIQRKGTDMMDYEMTPQVPARSNGKSSLQGLMPGCYPHENTPSNLSPPSMLNRTPRSLRNDGKDLGPVSDRNQSGSDGKRSRSFRKMFH